MSENKELAVNNRNEIEVYKENKEYDPQALKEDMNKFGKIIESANISMLNKPALKFMGLLAYSIHKEFYDSERYMKRSGNIPSLAQTDGESITYMLKPDATQSDIIFCTVHEILHIISHHVQRIGTRNPILWNLAVDHVVNSVLWEMSQAHSSGKNNTMIKWQEGSFFLQDVYNKKKGITPEELYEWLLQNQNRFKVQDMCNSNGCCNPGSTGQSGTGNGGDEGDDGDGEQGEGEGDSEGDSNGGGKQNQNKNKNNNGDDKNSNDKNNKNNKKDKNNSKDQNQNDGNGSGDTPIKRIVQITDTQTGATYTISYDVDPTFDKEGNVRDARSLEKFATKLENIRNSASALWAAADSMQMKGDLPGSLASYFEEVFRVEVPWEAIVENALTYECQNRQNSGYSWPNEIIKYPKLPGAIPSQEASALIAVIDSSGSVGNDDLGKFIGVVCKAAGLYEQIIVLVHDYVLQARWEISEDDARSEQAIFDKIKDIPGRGGTSHEEAFNEIDTIVEDFATSTIIFLTDYESDVQRIYKKHEWMKDHTTVWVLNSTHKIDLTDVDTMTVYINSQKKNRY